MKSGYSEPESDTPCQMPSEVSDERRQGEARLRERFLQIL